MQIIGKSFVQKNVKKAINTWQQHNMLYNRLINQLFRNRGKPHKKIKVKNWNTELLIFEKNVKKMSKTIKYTKSIDTMIKNFDNIKGEFEYIRQYKPCDIDLELNEQVINNVDDIDVIKDQFIKDFINSRIQEELEKEKIVTNVFLKESLIKKALNHALKAFTYFPNDAEIVCKISELEAKLLNCYKGVNENE